jgi:hypothetical protein
MKNNYIELMRQHCMDMDNFTSLDQLYERGEISGFSDFQQLRQAVNYLLEHEYLECTNYNRYSVMVTEKGKNFVENNFVYHTVEISKSNLRDVVGNLTGLLRRKP